MQENTLQIFNNSDFGEIRTIEENERVMFCGKDIAVSLGYADTKKALAQHCRRDGVAIYPLIDSLGREQQAKFIDEGNVYRLIAHSKLPSAERFERWVFDEILPSIRKHGAYLTAEKLHEVLSEPRNLATLLNTLADEQAKSKRLEEENLALSEEVSVLSEKANYCDRILDTKNAVPVTQIAKDYGMSAMGFNKMLHDYGVQYPIRKTWALYTKYAKLGYTQSKTYLIDRNRSSMSTCWTQKGRLFLYELLKEKGVLPMCERESRCEAV
ncbi:MAG: phage antirepressor KilAC domain-containing protein [Roseburia sp.]|nr:phage antirepressor KilAC domain-containing protein [Roseburia sp.]